MIRIVFYLIVFIAISACRTSNRSKQTLYRANQTVIKAQNDSSIKFLAQNCEFVRKYVENNIKKSFKFKENR